MKRGSSLFLVAVWLVSVSFLSAGCASEESPPPAKPAEAPAVPAAVQAMLADALRQMPAEVVALGTFRSPKAMVDQTNAFAGPEMSVLLAMPISFLPPRVFDMEGPVGWAVFLTGDEPNAVLLMRARPDAVLSGEDLGDGLVRVPLSLPLTEGIYCARRGDWIVFSGGEEAVRTFQAAPARLAVDAAQAARVGQALFWCRLSIPPLADKARTSIAAQRKQLASASGPEVEEQARFLTWVEGLLDEVQVLEFDGRMDREGLGLTASAHLGPDAELVGVAQALKPIETFEGMLPATEGLVCATWFNVALDELTPRGKAMLQPGVDFLLAQLDRMASAGRAELPPGMDPPPAPPFAAFGKVVRDMWTLTDEYQNAMGGQCASLVEVRPDTPFCVTETYTLKDDAAFRVLVDKAAGVANELIASITGSMPPSEQPSPKIRFEHVKNAETIEGVSVDILRYDLSQLMAPAAGGPMAEREAQRMKDMLAAVYGPEGLSFRLAVLDGRAIVAMGGKEVMARAIRSVRGQEGDVAKHPAVAAALQRLPKDARFAGLVSSPACVYLYARLGMKAIDGMLPPDARKALADVPLPALEQPAIGDLATMALRVDGNVVSLDMYMPASEIERSIPVMRQAFARLMFNGLQMGVHSVPKMVLPPPMEDWEPNEDFFDEPVPENPPTEAPPEPAPAPLTE